MKISNILSRNIIIGLLFFLVGGLIVNNILYTHFHQMANGGIVVHAHPFNKTTSNQDSAANHDHNNAEMLFYDSVLLLFFLILISVLLIALRRGKDALLLIMLNFYSNEPQLVSQRAPPILL